MPSNTTLKDVGQVGDSLLSDQLEFNALSFFQWGLLGAGGFFNVTIPSSGAYGGDYHRLAMASDQNFSDGQVWQGDRKDWVWESGVECAYQPIRVSGVYVNGGFHPITSTGTYAHHVDYPLGRVVFDEPISPTSVVTCEYSYRLCQMYTADVPWWQEVQPDSFRVDDFQFRQQGSGAWDVLGQSRIQLPAVVVQAVMNARRRPFEIGNATQIVSQDVLFHVVAEDRPSMKFLFDAITYQKDKRLSGIDKNALLAADKFPLDEWGSPVGTGLMYPDLIKPTGEGGFYWRQLRCVETRASEQPRLGDLHYATVRATFEVDL